MSEYNKVAPHEAEKSTRLDELLDAEVAMDRGCRMAIRYLLPFSKEREQWQNRLVEISSITGLDRTDVFDLINYGYSLGVDAKSEQEITGALVKKVEEAQIITGKKVSQADREGYKYFKRSVSLSGSFALKLFRRREGLN